MIYITLQKILDTLMRIWIQIAGLALCQKQIISTQAEHGKMLMEILEWVKPKQAVRVVFNVYGEDYVINGATQMIMKTKQQFDIAPIFLDDKGQPAPVQGIPVWTNSNETSLTMTVAPDGLSAHVESIALGTGQITLQADADLGEGVKLISGVLEVDVQAGEATVVQMNAGPVTDVPPPAPVA